MPSLNTPANAAKTTSPPRWPQPTDPSFKGFGGFELSPLPDSAQKDRSPMHLTTAKNGRHHAINSFVGLPYELEPPAAADFPNGYHFPPRHSFVESLKLSTMAFLKYVRTPMGFLITLYCLNVVAWGGMIFLLSLNAAPAMCRPTCEDNNSPRKIWIEIDAQILNALFCVIGFGLAPWRLQQLYLLMRYRVRGDKRYLRRLAGIHREWFRLAGSTTIPPFIGPHNVEVAALEDQLSAIPSPETKIPVVPLTGVRAPPTRAWKLDLVIWMRVFNTLLQVGLATLMWAFNRFNRPAWATNLVVVMACAAGTVDGVTVLREKRTIKRVEGVPVTEKDQERLKSDKARGIWHYNNIKDKDLSGKR
ncbi:hypothetical protein L249_1060 [Ophiocordyceps polyrhachis-furcata BCC 54312]|uniref:Uncharacterized protein n=1 Tax=Ophiocordyceps polyrhachis-furcata BCC 54312 TaxID=1330021 RepID=A0A367LE81_9HYPO|nr:hypothetical protein L249_1060 [Ophiocordyceps polyrhachis-furcata BCC 54312]